MADRLTLSLLPPPIDQKQTLRPWAASLRGNDERWQKLSQDGVQLFMGLIMDQHIPFAFETVFSYLRRQADGAYRSKADTIGATAGRLFCCPGICWTSKCRALDLASKYSAPSRGHDVPLGKLQRRFPRTQEAIRMAAPLADMTFMFDNSRAIDKAFSLVRVQTKATVLYDAGTRHFLKIRSCSMSLISGCRR